MASESNSKVQLIGGISFIAMIGIIAIAVLIAPASWGQGVQPRPQFAYIAGNNSVSAYVIDSTTGALTEINGSPFPTGNWARGVAADPQGHFLYIPNWYSANVSAYLINGDTGALSTIPGSPFAAGDHPAAVAVDPLGRFVYIANQYADTISVYSMNPTTGALTPVTGSPFNTYVWPVGLASGPSGKFLYVANFGGYVSVYAIAGNGGLTEIAGSPYYAGSGTFQVAIPPSGKFAYAAAQYSNGVFAYLIDSATGALTEIQGSPFLAGLAPYFIAVDPSGRFVYTANFYFGLSSGNVSGYTIDAGTGSLTAIPGSPFPAGNNPGGIAVDLSGRFVYTANDGSSTSSGYVINPSTGGLISIPGSPFPTAINPISVTTVGSPGPRSSTVTTIASGVNPSVFAQAVSFAVKVTSDAGTPTGVVQIMNGSSQVASGTLVNGAVSIPVSTLPAGADLVTASYFGDIGFAGSKSTALTQTVTKAMTSTSLASSLSSVGTDQSLTLTATVTGQYGGAVTGTVAFSAGSQALGNAVLSGNVASLTTSFANAGTYAITAHYNGGANNTGSTSASLSEKVLASTNTTLTSSLNPSVVGQAVTFTAVVAPSGGTLPNGESLTFYNGSAVLGTAVLNGGTAVLTSSSLPAGIFVIKASYPGDLNFAPSTSAGIRQVVNSTTKYATATALVSMLNPSIYGQAVTLTAKVTTSSPIPPTGTVAFTWKYFTTSYTIGTATVNSNGVAMLTRSNLNAGPFLLTAVYRGDANNLASTSMVVNQTVMQTTSSATITSSLNPSSLGQAVTFTAKITSPTVMPTGPVTFRTGTAVLGTAQLSGGKATFTTSNLPAGSSVIKVTYTGNSNIKGSSASITQTVQP